MSSVTARIEQIKQPWGGYLKLSEFETIQMDDNQELMPDENIHGTIVGMVVDYLTRYMVGEELRDAFDISIKGATIAEAMGMNNAVKIIFSLLDEVKGIDDNSIVNACKVVAFDVWYRNPVGAIMAKRYDEIKPNKETIYNIQILIKRSINFIKGYGPITHSGITFEPKEDNAVEYKKMLETGEGVYGGYTATVESGDGDFLTADTLWDFKVTKRKPTSKHTLQLLMYWIMGQHSGQNKFKKITKIGIFNPRFNKVYLLEIKNVSKEIIEIVENEVICYE